MTTPKTAAPQATRKLLYSGPAGKVWADGLELYSLKAEGITVQGAMAGGPSNQPTPEEIAAVSSATQNVFGPLKPWMIALIFVLVFAGLQAAGAPGWLGVVLLLLALVVLIGLPVSRQLKAVDSMYHSRDEITLLLSDTPTQMVSSLVEIDPNTPQQTIKPARQPVAVVVRGLSPAERAKLGRAVTQHMAIHQALAARSKK